MANDGKFVNIDSTSGLPKQEAGATAGGAGDANKIPALDAGGKLAQGMMPVGIAPEILTVTTSENLSAGDMVNLYNNGGTFTARKADGSAAGKPVDGFVLAATTSGQNAAVYPEEATNTGASGLTIGSDVFLSVSTPGQATSTVPTGAGKVAQMLGKAISATSFTYRRGVPITLA